MLKNTKGQWVNSMLELHCKTLKDTINGARNVNLIFYKELPICDIDIIQDENYPYTVYREIKTRSIFYHNKQIFIQCGDIMSNTKDSLHK
ncbi:MAG: hypothetical protein LBJ61_00035 [Deltaproteobacteria bacterium]|jgi:hypothetical protein|nr:hypothetical protein [Deltaproteobacteria bacterium]